MTARDVAEELEGVAAGRAEKMLQFIVDNLAAGRTVYLSTPLRRTKIRPKDLPLVRVKHGALQIQHGKKWIDYTFTALSAE